MAGNRAFGERIRRLREEKKRTNPSFTLRGFAGLVGISPTFLSKVENGEFNPPARDKIEKMATLLNADPDELLALAGKVSEELQEIVRKTPKAMADFLRTAHEKGLTEKDIRRLTEQIRQGKKP